LLVYCHPGINRLSDPKLVSADYVDSTFRGAYVPPILESDLGLEIDSTTVQEEPIPSAIGAGATPAYPDPPVDLPEAVPSSFPYDGLLTSAIPIPNEPEYTVDDPPESEPTDVRTQQHVLEVPPVVPRQLRSSTTSLAPPVPPPQLPA
jgi:hypothetical protein